MKKKITVAKKVLTEGGIIAYPTEGVYGLGCDPFNETAVLRLLKIKQRPINKGLILIAANWEQVKGLISIKLTEANINSLNSSLTPTTWIFPASKKVPKWISGKYKTVAIRVTTHLLAKQLCLKFGGAIVSTSANLTNELPVRKAKNLNIKILSLIDLIIKGAVGSLKKPTQIMNFQTNKLIRC